MRKYLFLILAIVLTSCGLSNLPQVTDSIVKKTHVNDPRLALYEHLCPRNTSGVCTSEAGGLGTSSFSWADSYIKKIFLGDTGSTPFIGESGTNDIQLDTGTASKQILFKVNAVTKGVVDTNGVDGAYLKAVSVAAAALASDSVTTAKILDANGTAANLAAGVRPVQTCQTFSGNGTFTPASTVSWVVVIGAGGGGGGGGGAGGVAANGGGGGSGATVHTCLTEVTPSVGVSVVVGAGGAGGAGGVDTTSGQDGSAGVASSFGGTPGCLFAAGLGGGGGDPGGGGGEAGLTRNATSSAVNAGGGAGGIEGAAGQNGSHSIYSTAGAGGTSANNTLGGGGGGGGAGYAAAGAGGTNTVTSSNGTAGSGGGYGAGGGGGSGAGGSSANNDGGAGGEGGAGRVVVCYVD